MKRKSSVVVCGLIWLLASPSCGAEGQAALMNNEGVSALNQGNFKLAIEKFQGALRVDPNYKYAKDNLSVAYNPNATNKSKNCQVVSNDDTKAFKSLAELEFAKIYSSAKDFKSTVLPLAKGNIVKPAGGPNGAPAPNSGIGRMSGGGGPASAPAPTRATHSSQYKAVLDAMPSSVVPVASPSVSGYTASTRTISVTSDDFGPYLADLNRRLKRAWFTPKNYEDSLVRILFKIQRNGEMTGLRLETSAGYALCDQAAIKAAENASPFRPLPDGSPEYIEIITKFRQDGAERIADSQLTRDCASSLRKTASTPSRTTSSLVPSPYHPPIPAALPTPVPSVASNNSADSDRIAHPRPSLAPRSPHKTAVVGIIPFDFDCSNIPAPTFGWHCDVRSDIGTDVGMRANYYCIFCRDNLADFLAQNDISVVPAPRVLKALRRLGLSNSDSGSVRKFTLPELSAISNELELDAVVFGSLGSYRTVVTRESGEHYTDATYRTSTTSWLNLYVWGPQLEKKGFSTSKGGELGIVSDFYALSTPNTSSYLPNMCTELGTRIKDYLSEITLADD